MANQLNLPPFEFHWQEFQNQLQQQLPALNPHRVVDAQLAPPARNQPIRWEITHPADGDNAAETHCAICRDPDDSKTILGHPLLGNNGEGEELTHRVHQTCLLAFNRDICPQCRIPYHRDEIPRPLSERLIEQGKIIGMEAFENLWVYLGAAILFSFLPVGFECTMGLIKGRDLFFPFSGAMVGAIAGAVSSSLICSSVGEVVEHLGIRVIERIDPRDPNFRRVLIIAAIAVSILTSCVILYYMCKTVLNRMIAPLSRNALTVYKSYMYPKMGLSIEKLPKATLKAGAIAFKRIITFILSAEVTVIANVIYKTLRFDQLDWGWEERMNRIRG